MLTIFSTAKAFRGHFGVIQRNALRSWTMLHPDVEVILFGDDEGAAETAREFAIRHEPHVERDEFGTNRLDYIFSQAQAIGRHSLLCYANCDILLMSDFWRAIGRVSSKYSRFLMVGKCWDTPIAEPIDFSDPAWANDVRRTALSTNAQRGDWWVDYFAFRRGFCNGDMPAFGVGRARWDNWMIWRALSLRMAVVDASASVMAVHQRHDYTHVQGGEYAVYKGEGARRNAALSGGIERLLRISDATHELTARGRPRSKWLRDRRDAVKTLVAGRLSWPWYWFLNLTRSARHALGLSRSGILKLKHRVEDRKNPA